MPKKPLSKKREAFCREYVKDSNGAKAAERAGYAKRTSRITASKLLTISNVKERIGELEKKAAKRANLTVDEVLEDLELLRDISFGKKPNPATGETDYNPTAGAKAIELRGRYLAMFTDKTDNKHSVKFDDYTDDELRAIIRGEK